MNSKNMIDQTLSFIEHIRFLISNSVACTEELLLVTGILSLAQAKLIEFRDTNINKNEMDKEFMKILEACEHFTLLLQLAQRHVWPCISLSLDITSSGTSSLFRYLGLKAAICIATSLLTSSLTPSITTKLDILPPI